MPLFWVWFGVRKFSIYHQLMSETQYFWWVLTAVLVVLELVTGTFYLLVLALGCAGGGIAALAGLGISGQIGSTAIVCLAGWGYLRKRQKQKSTAMPPPSGDSAVNLDVGEILDVVSWQENRTCEVRYRGSVWQAELAAGIDLSAARPGRYIIEQVTSNRLVLRPA
jgi:membrane protein implicated in regulation of membrane protease activity